MKTRFALLGVIILLAMLAGCNAHKGPEVKIMELNENWEFLRLGEDKWYPATVPGSVHTDLLARGHIEDPFYRDHEDIVQWIENEDWEYRTVFHIDKDTFHKERIEMVFKGLDTYASVYLNGDLILEADNMFRGWRLDVKPIIKEGANKLRILFRSPVKSVKEKWEQLGYQLPGGPKVMTRKPGYHYGWDWGPKLTTSGIWRPIVLEAWDTIRITGFRILQQKLEPETAYLRADIEFERLEYRGQYSELVIEAEGFKEPLARFPLEGLDTGKKKVRLGIEIPEPRLWWSNGLGEAHLYRITASIKQGSRIMDARSQTIGLRTIELVREPDEHGESFYFKLNGVPVFMKGANYIPQDNFIARVTPERYRKLIDDAKAANMNMLRVWGGGFYENDIFYDLCDEAGILVWQDFMFACAMYPGDPEYLESVKQEAIENIKRLRHHACLALWCGNNEINEAWHNWGWQPRLTPEQRETIWGHYQKIFHEILPQAVKEHDGTLSYWPSSPSYGRADSRSLTEGDSHYWGVWHEAKPFSEFIDQVPRFMSEYGFQSFPPEQTVGKFALPRDRALDSEVMKVHQKHPRGNELIRTYMERDYRFPEDFGHFLYLSQVLQAEGMRIGIEAHRRAMPYCMGTLYWQLNDCWPAVSWSGIDYYGNWKALHYFVRKAFDEVLVSPALKQDQKGDRLEIYVVSDSRLERGGVLDMRLMDLEGNEYWQQQKPLTIEANTSRVYFDIATAELLKNKDKTALLFSAQFRQDENIVATNIFYFVPPKDMKLPDPQLQVAVEPVDAGFEITLAAATLARNVYLYAEGIDGHFSDNFFDLLPGQPVTVVFETADKTADLASTLKVLSLFNVMK